MTTGVSAQAGDTPVDSFDREALKKLIQESGIKFKQNQGSYIFDCPHCGKSEKLWIRKKDGRFICFYCADIDRFKGRAEYALKDLLNQPLDAIKEKLYGFSSREGENTYITIDLKGFTEEEELVTPPPKEISWPWDSYEITSSFAARGAAYLESRGIPLHVASAYGIRYWPTQRRVLFPVFVDGVLVGYQGRAVYKTEWEDSNGMSHSGLKILTSQGMDRSNEVMFYDRLRGSKHVVLCEGPVDALKAHLCGGNIATMGKVVSRGQLNLIRGLGIEKVYLALDPDASDEAAKVAQELGDDLQLFLMYPPDGFKDLGDMTLEAVRELFDSARPISRKHLFVYLRPPASYTSDLM
jgi:hypothetical protein